MVIHPDPGTRFGRLTVVSGPTRKKGRLAYACSCDCGVEKLVYRQALFAATTRSCGCLRSVGPVKHGHSSHGVCSKEYTVWIGMKQRCLNSRNSRFSDYGGRGITVCQRWRDSFAAFLKDMGMRPEGCQLDRIDVDGNYEPSNCRWASRTIQVRNKRTTVRVEYAGTRWALRDLAEMVGMDAAHVSQRVRRGIPLARALSRQRLPRGPKPKSPGAQNVKSAQSHAGLVLSLVEEFGNATLGDMEPT